ncbi:MAG: ATPase [Armatimonadota bacterium]|nr:MAG: ATPase [Armatimonadota bacterium]
MPQTLVMGIDGGQSTTRALIADAEGNLLGLGVGGASNHIHEPGGPERLRHSLRTALNGALQSASLTSDTRFVVALCGMTGGGALVEEICRQELPAEKVVVVHDTRTALYCITQGEPGAVVIAGTGSVAFGVNASGEAASVGGWGYLMGDEGSAYWIALQALNVCTRAEDGRIPNTWLKRAILEHFGVESLSALHRLIYSGQLSRGQLAAAARAVSDAARLGERMAIRILSSAGKELGLMAVVVLRKLGMQYNRVKVGIVGGVARAPAPLHEAFRARVYRSTLAEVVQPRFPMVIAAVCMALEQAGVAVDERLWQRMEEQMGRFGL